MMSRNYSHEVMMALRCRVCIYSIRYVKAKIELEGHFCGCWKKKEEIARRERRVSVGRHEKRRKNCSCAATVAGINHQGRRVRPKTAAIVTEREGDSDVDDAHFEGDCG